MGSWWIDLRLRAFRAFTEIPRAREADGDAHGDRSIESGKMVRKAKVEFDETPPEIDLSNPYGDPVAMLDYREHLVREKWIQIETAKILRDRLRWCYRVEGVNHHQKCRHLVHQYLEATRGVGWCKDTRPYDLHGPKKDSD